MKYGIRNGMLGEPLESEFATAKKIGLDGIEFCIGGNYKSELLWTDGGMENLKVWQIRTAWKSARFHPVYLQDCILRFPMKRSVPKGSR